MMMKMISGQTIRVRDHSGCLMTVSQFFQRRSRNCRRKAMEEAAWAVLETGQIIYQTVARGLVVGDMALGGP